MPTPEPAPVRPAKRLRAQLKRAVFTSINAIGDPLSRFAPRSKRVWAFGHADDQFAGNPKYLYLWISLYRPDIDAVWITGDARLRDRLVARGLRAERRWSLAGLRAALQAGVYVYSHFAADVNVAVSNGAYRVNLWHGVGLKAIGLGLDQGRTAQAQAAASAFWSRAEQLKYLTFPDIVATTSDFMQAHFASQFLLPNARCPQLGYPRLDCATDPEVRAAAEALDDVTGFRWNADGFAETYIYMPTSRDTERPFIEEAMPDLARLSQILAARNAVLYLKLHARTNESLPGLPANIRVWPRDVDFQTYLHRFDRLITDYSSVLYDYLQVRGAGAILYVFDFDRYVTADRPLLYPFEENTAGVRAVTFDELCSTLASGDGADPEGQAQVDRVRARFWGGSATPASPAIVDYVERAIE